ncbi:homoserine kinase [Thiohalorhabdus methylotrophus]|uniref:Homoserine kinase n=1 Tax=Thiohalorhabdus methylotrophus TaxID=3242694 RepID=A0ABV4TPH0_9GAMM
MSVYTSVTSEQLDEFLAHFRQIGQARDLQGISQGVENTNYFLTTEKGEYILTIFERVPEQDLPFFLNLMAFLANDGLPVPQPVLDDEGRYLRRLAGKLAAIVTKLAGRTIYYPGVDHCAEVGGVLGRMHKAGQRFPDTRDNPRGPGWWKETAEALEGDLSPDEHRLLQDELTYQYHNRRVDLPRGVIHADLFHDNALFEEGQLTGVIDFYYACSDVLAFDLAIVVNDWCTHPDGTLNPYRTRALLKQYNAERPLSSVEEALWPVMLRGAALRFWLSRLWDYHHPRDGELTSTKDPDTFRAILEARRDLPQNAWIGWPKAVAE